MNNRNTYPKNWTTHIRPSILVRDKFKCQHCFLAHGSTGYWDKNGNYIECDEFMYSWAKANGFKVSKKYLVISHIDSNPMNNDNANLISLCPRCHIIADNKIRALKRIAPKN